MRLQSFLLHFIYLIYSLLNSVFIIHSKHLHKYITLLFIEQTDQPSGGVKIERLLIEKGITIGLPCININPPSLRNVKSWTIDNHNQCQNEKVWRKMCTPNDDFPCDCKCTIQFNIFSGLPQYPINNVSQSQCFKNHLQTIQIYWKCFFFSNQFCPWKFGPLALYPNKNLCGSLLHSTTSQ